MNNYKRERIGAVIVAAGMSTRMGEFKQTLMLGDKTFIERIVMRFMKAGVDPIVVVLGYKAELLREILEPYPVTVVENRDYASSQMFDSISMGFRAVKDRCDRFFFTPVDVPAFRASILSAELERNEDIVIPVRQGRDGHPVLLKSSLVPRILEYTGNRGLHGAMEELAVRKLYLDWPDEGSFLDADTPEDYKRIKDIYAENNEDEVK